MREEEKKIRKAMRELDKKSLVMALGLVVLIALTVGALYMAATS
jgi:hypothetical protein